LSDTNALMADNGEILDFLRARFGRIDDRFDRIDQKLDEVVTRLDRLEVAGLQITRACRCASTTSIAGFTASSAGSNWSRRPEAPKARSFLRAGTPPKSAL
jgi:hypothetical protein